MIATTEFCPTHPNSPRAYFDDKYKKGTFNKWIKAVGKFNYAIL